MRDVLSVFPVPQPPKESASRRQNTIPGRGAAWSPMAALSKGPRFWKSSLL